MHGADSRPKAKIATRMTHVFVAVLDAVAGVSYPIDAGVPRGESVRREENAWVPHSRSGHCCSF